MLRKCTLLAAKTLNIEVYLRISFMEQEKLSALCHEQNITTFSLTALAISKHCKFPVSKKYTWCYADKIICFLLHHGNSEHDSQERTHVRKFEKVCCKIPQKENIFTPKYKSKGTYMQMRNVKDFFSTVHVNTVGVTQTQQKAYRAISASLSVRQVHLIGSWLI